MQGEKSNKQNQKESNRGEILQLMSQVKRHFVWYLKISCKSVRLKVQ